MAVDADVFEVGALYVFVILHIPLLNVCTTVIRAWGHSLIALMQVLHGLWIRVHLVTIFVLAFEFQRIKILEHKSVRIS